MNLPCLTSLGVFTPEQEAALSKSLTQLPGNTNDLIKALIGLTLINVNSSSPDAVLGYQQITLLPNFETPLSPSVLTAKRAMITCYKSPAIFRVDGGIPSQDNGHYIPINSTIEINGISSFKAISVDDAVNSILFVTYY